MQVLPQALAPLAAYPQFILYKLATRNDGTGKVDKLPIDHRTGRVMERDTDWQNDPGAWADAQSAIARAQQLGPNYGVGFLFRNDDPFFFVDIDGALQSDGQWSDVALDLCHQLAGAAVEVSQSGTGLHVIGTARHFPEHGCKNAAHGLELYTGGRFVALTGAKAVGDASTDHTARLEAITAQYFPPGAGSTEDPTRAATWTSKPVSEWSGPTDDAELIDKARAASGGAGQAFGGRASFDALWRGDAVALGRAYPDHYHNPPRPFDPSSADAALAAHLAFWTGCDCERIERLMWQSGLVRDKWDRKKHRTYLERTILNAVSRCDSVIGSRSSTPTPESVEPSPVVSQAPGGELVDGFQFLAATQQMEHFAGCVYVQDIHRVFTPRGTLLTPQQFKATYGGYLFTLDATNDKTTKNAWEAFTESQAVRYSIAEGQTFRPELPPGELVIEEGRQLVNTYMPAAIDRKPGDVTPFLNHLYKTLPDENDAAIFLAYMAACVQHIGVKFQWAPLLQGVEGNGKTLFTRCVARAVGMEYSHFPKADEVGNKFNSWMMRRLFIGIEDVYYPQSRQEIIESLKPLITNDMLPIEYKGADQINARVCANFMLNSNHKDAIRKTHNDRRFAIFFSAQQQKRDIQRDGMDGDYFPDLYDWLKGGGYAYVAEFLSTYPIPDDLNPATRCHRAPKTSTTDQAIAHSIGGVEQEILEAIEEGRPGFAGGWVSSMALDRLIESKRLGNRIPPNRRREIMQGLGYDWHPALTNGRVNTLVALDGGKPKLFIRDDHPDRSITAAGEVTKAYEAAQGGGPQTPAERAFAGC